MTPALLATLPIAPGLESVFMLPKFLALALYLSMQTKWRKHPSGVNLGVAIYLGTQVLSAVFSVIPTLSWLGVFRDHSTGIAADLLLISLFYLDVPAKDLVRGLRWAGGLVAASFLIVGEVGNREIGLIGSPVYAGAVLAICAPHMPWLLGAVVLTHSRGAIAAALLACSIGRKWALALLLVALPAAVAYVAVARPTALSDSGRISLYKTAIASWRHKPLLGHGPSTFVQSIWAHNQGWDYRRSERSMTTQSHAHNWAMELLASTGIIGLLGFLVMLLLVGRDMQGPASLWASLLAGALISFVNPLGLPAKALMVMCASAMVRREHV